MKNITESIIFETNESLWAAAAKKHGSLLRVSREDSAQIGDMIRGLYVLQMWQKRGGQAGNPVRFLQEYSIGESTINELIATYLGDDYLAEAVEKAKPERRADKWKALEEWAKQNFLKEVTTEELVRLSGFSYPTVLNYVKTSPYFRKVKRGSWEVRDPKADREAEKVRS